MFDVVHPKVSLPNDNELRAALERGQMVLDVLIGLGVPVTYARTRVIPSLLSPRERAGKLLGVRRTTAVLELEELIYAGRDERVAYSRDLFAPGGLDVAVMRSLESTRPDADRELPRLPQRPRRRRRARAVRERADRGSGWPRWRARWRCSTRSPRATPASA